MIEGATLYLPLDLPNSFQWDEHKPTMIVKAVMYTNSI